MLRDKGKHDLTVQQVEDMTVVIGKDSSPVVDQLYAFGSSVLEEALKRRERIESKAVRIFTWALGILSFILFQVNSVSHNRPNMGLVFSALCAAISVVLCFTVIKTRNNASPSDEDWFRKDCLDSESVYLKMFHVRSMHKVRHETSSISDKKSMCLLYAEASLGLSGVSIFVVVIGRFLGYC
jgi:hypothetical protein